MPRTKYENQILRFSKVVSCHRFISSLVVWCLDKQAKHQTESMHPMQPKSRQRGKDKISHSSWRLDHVAESSPRHLLVMHEQAKQWIETQCIHCNLKQHKAEDKFWMPTSDRNKIHPMRPEPKQQILHNGIHKQCNA